MPESRSLALSWFLRADPTDIGLVDGWKDAAFDADLWIDAGECAAWQQVLGQDHFGIAWYRTRATIPTGWNARCSILRFNAVATHIQVWVNGHVAGSHTGDYVPFDIDMTSWAAPGAQLEIVCRVDQLMPVPAPAEWNNAEGKYETWGERAAIAKPGEMGYPGHITKGFHDVLSIAHGGIWQPVHLLGFGAIRTVPDGIAVRADGETGSVEVIAELSETVRERGCLRVTLCSSDSIDVARSETLIEVGAAEARLRVHVESPRRWSPNDPNLYRAVIEIDDSTAVSQHEVIPFGFRTLATTEKHILLNGSPIFIRGVLHWGHEPRHMAPAPPPDQVRSEFAALKEHGFNCVCLCMWYPPRHYFDIADEMGMLLWQEHPVWQSPMADEHLPEYQRLYRAFMRRDRNHPSVVVVSGTCEHPKFHPELARWWWAEAKSILPGKLHQVQTSSFAWSEPDQTDLYDEHTYENTNRWPLYLEDLQHTLKAMKVQKPFVMGETIVFSVWPEMSSLDLRESERMTRRLPWWAPKSMKAAQEFEESLARRYGELDTLWRFKEQSLIHAILNRKFQIEQLRLCSNHAAVVMNHIRDVPGCTCGFLDDWDDWRFAGKRCSAWLADRVFLLRTPGNRRSFVSAERIDIQVCISDFGRIQCADHLITVMLSRLCDSRKSRDRDCRQAVHSLTSASGSVAELGFSGQFDVVAEPVAGEIIVRHHDSDGPRSNQWNLWIFPGSRIGERGIHRLSSLPFTPEESSPDHLEKGYSRGFGLPIRQWQHRMPDPSILCPDAIGLSHDAPIPVDCRVLLSHRLTKRILDWLSAGGRLIHFASRGRDALPNVYEWFFGQCPLVIEEGPIGAGDSQWIVELLGTDLTRTYARMIPSDCLGITDLVDPLIRYVYIHDAREKLRFFDGLFMTRVGKGLLMVSSLDHHDPAGQYLLARMIEFLQRPDATAQHELPVSRVAEWACG